jgi:hypothetical protein
MMEQPKKPQTKHEVIQLLERCIAEMSIINMHLEKIVSNAKTQKNA